MLSILKYVPLNAHFRMDILAPIQCMVPSAACVLIPNGISIGGYKAAITALTYISNYQSHRQTDRQTDTRRHNDDETVQYEASYATRRRIAMRPIIDAAILRSYTLFNPCKTPC